jgi:hypothetical protein
VRDGGSEYEYTVSVSVCSIVRLLWTGLAPPLASSVNMIRPFPHSLCDFSVMLQVEWRVCLVHCERATTTVATPPLIALTALPSF